MPTTTLAGREIAVDDEGFLTDRSQWDRDLGAELATQIGVEMTDRHWEVITFLRDDFAKQGETATTRRVQAVGGFPTKEQFELFPKKPAKKMAYIAGLPKPRGVRVMSAPIIPNFDDASSQGRKLAIICSKGNLDMAYPGLILGNAALGEGVETHLFFTFWGLDMINKETMGKLKFSFVGNTAMHPPGRFNVSMPQILGGVPGMTSIATKMMKKSIADLDVPEVPEFLEQIVGAGGHLWACRMSIDMNGLTKQDLYDGVEDIISASDFIEMTDGAQMLFI